MLVVIINKLFPASCPASVPGLPYNQICEAFAVKDGMISLGPFTQKEAVNFRVLGAQDAASARGLWSQCLALGSREGTISTLARCIQTCPGERLPAVPPLQSPTPHLSAVPEKWPQVEDSREMHAFLPSRVCLPHSTVPVVGPRSDQCCDLLPGCQLSVRLWAQPGQPSPEPQQPAGAHGCPPRSPGPRAGLPALCQQEAEPLWVHQHHCPHALLPGGWV